MSKLEDIVPPLELCKRIPAGAFEDSALVWTVHGVRSVEELSRLEFCKDLPIRKMTFPPRRWRRYSGFFRKQLIHQKMNFVFFPLCRS